ncbi:spore germination protein [Paenibacillus xylanivorans]|uniref:Spore gernimation protein GerA n=1 Tax=Paenibacillus xylanivorans TaxID=1705561 RepID=A0A0N0C5F3_9BACL|nr:spore germination protein [Paenibacillus xylanivorans]KOY17175.1 spore gernimation protein GerA [Paenibacillus xylanivorans]
MWSKILSYVPEWPIWGQAFLLFLLPILYLKGFQWLRSSLKKGTFSNKDQQNQDASTNSSSSNEETGSYANIQLTGDYAKDLISVKATFGQNADVFIREFTIRGTNTPAAVIYVDGLVDHDLIDTHMFTPLMIKGVPDTERKIFEQPRDANELKAYVRSQLLPVSQVQEAETLQQAARAVLTGKNALFIEGMTGALLVGSAKGKSRSLEEPVSEALLRGPRIGFTERLSDNTGILRQFGGSNALFMTKHQVGTRVKRDLVIAYIEDIANADLVTEVEKRVQNLDMDIMLESGYVEQLIEDDELSPFQQVQNTERPDRVVSGLLEGRVAILLDGTPFALIVPSTFSMLLQSPEDYYERWIPGTFLRMLRFLAATIALLGPALYISFISFHPGLIPTKLALTIIQTRQGVPFPSIIEALIMETSIEILREAGIRLPKPIGPAMGIVGGLIIGEAAVQAGIVSPFLVIVVAVTAISSFAIPTYSAGITLRILRFFGMFSAAIFGLYGVVMFFLLLCSHLVRLKSFGIPYVTPAVPYSLSDWKDFFIRAPLGMMKQRPSMMHPKDPDRKK